MTEIFLESAAEFDDRRIYRYTLTRVWDKTKDMVLWVMLNPSVADEEVLDPTLRRCVGFSKSLGYGGMIICNLFALRSTDPAQLYNHADPVGDLNDIYIQKSLLKTKLTLAGWGTHGSLKDRDKEVLVLLSLERPVYCLKITAQGKPNHPLYLPASASNNLQKLF